MGLMESLLRTFAVIVRFVMEPTRSSSQICISPTSDNTQTATVTSGTRLNSPGDCKCDCVEMLTITLNPTPKRKKKVTTFLKRGCGAWVCRLCVGHLMSLTMKACKKSPPRVIPSRLCSATSSSFFQSAVSFTNGRRGEIGVIVTLMKKTMSRVVIVDVQHILDVHCMAPEACLECYCINYMKIDVCCFCLASLNSESK